MEIGVSYYHIVVEVNDHISTIEETRDIELFNIEDLAPYLHALLLPYFNKQMIEFEDENILFEDILQSLSFAYVYYEEVLNFQMCLTIV